MRTIYALGIGHNTPVFIELALDCGYSVAGLYHYNDSRTGEVDHKYEILGSFDDLFALESLQGKSFLLTMGDNEIRQALFDKIISKGGEVPTLIHPTAVISRFAKVADVGVIISPFTYVQADSSIGKNTVLLSHVDICHTSSIGENCFIASKVTIGAYTKVGDNVFIGMGTLSISAKVKNIGDFAYIGARSLLTKNVPEYAVVCGSPAKILNFKNKIDNG